MSTQPNFVPQFEATKVTTFRDLVVWGRAMDFVETCYKLTDQIPQSEIHGLTGQIRKAAVSIPARIAEGHGRKTAGEYLELLFVANGSLKELETHLMIAGRLHFVKEEDIFYALDDCEEIGQMLTSLIQKLRQKRF
jgi:four helix bundle protein